MGSNTAQYKINDDKNESCRATLVDSQKKKTLKKSMILEMSMIGPL